MSGMFPDHVLYTPQGVRRTRALFKEFCSTTDTPVFTVGRDKSGDKSLVNLKTMYINFCVNDPTEVAFADTVFGDWSFWDNMTKAAWIQDDLALWRQEVDARRKAVAFTAIIDELNDKTKKTSNLQAARFLIEEPWKDKRNPKVKRDSNKSTEKGRSLAPDLPEEFKEFLN